jgi:hypothetical protein
MGKLFTREQAREWLRENKLKDVKSIEDAFTPSLTVLPCRGLTIDSERFYSIMLGVTL